MPFQPHNTFARKFLLFGESRIRYLLRDDFNDTLAAGSVNGTLSTPGPGTRTTTDTENKISIGSGVVTCAGQKTVAAFRDPQILITAVARAAGVVGCWRHKPATNDKYSLPSFQNANAIAHAFNFAPANFYSVENAAYGTLGAGIGEYSGASIYDCMIALRAAGAFLLMRGGKYDGKLLYHVSADVRAALQPAIVNYTATWESATIRAAQSNWLPTPEISDGMSAAAASDGAGHAETSGLGSGGSGVAWADRVGTWGVGSGVRACTALGGGVGLCTATLTSPSVIASVKITRTAGVAGIVLRWVDANNYVYIHTDATTITVRKVLGGVDSQVVAPTAITYSAGKRLVVVADCHKYRLIYNEVLVTTTQITDAALQSGLGFGLYTTDTGNTFDDALVYAVGVEGQYSQIFDRYLSGRSRTSVYCIGDSKTDAADGYVEKLSTYTEYFAERPYRYSVAGLTTAAAKMAIDARLAITVGAPDYVFYNLGVNDTNGADGITPSEADWKTNTAYIFDAIHAKFPAAKIYIMDVWCRASPNACNTLATWMDTVIATRTDFCFTGPDERVFLEGGDDGATYTSDGIHPNTAGYTLTAAQWRAAISA